MHEAGGAGGVAAARRVVFVGLEHVAAAARGRGAGGIATGQARPEGEASRQEPKPPDARDKRIAELERKNRRLEAKLAQAETVIVIQKKVASLLGIPLKSSDPEEND